MRKFILIVLLLVAPHSFAFAPNAPDQRAINAFYQNSVGFDVHQATISVAFINLEGQLLALLRS